ncbi:36444_t:CDS:1, partial [Racocetra persica]
MVCSSLVFNSSKNYYKLFLLYWLVDYKITASTREVHPNDEDSSVLAKLEKSLKTLFPRHPMSLAHYTNPPDEIDLVYQEFTDADLLALTTPENDNDADNINDSSSSFTTPSNSIKLDAIRTVISLLNTTISDHNAIFRTLRSLQRDIWLQVSSSKVQAILDRLC